MNVIALRAEDIEQLVVRDHVREVEGHWVVLQELRSCRQREARQLEGFVEVEAVDELSLRPDVFLERLDRSVQVFPPRSEGGSVCLVSRGYLRLEVQLADLGVEQVDVF